MRKGFAWLVLLVLMLVLGSAHAQPGKVTYVYTDPQGTPLAEADANGSITATFDYKPYGSQLLASPYAGPGYTGHVNDPDTGFVYMQARYYDPAAGRFLSIDPVVPAAGNLFNINRFDYVNDNPINHIDEDGRCADADFSCGRIVAAQGAYAAAHPNQPLSPVAKVGLGAMLTASGAGAVVEAVNGAAILNKILSESSSSSPKLTEGQAKNLTRFEKKFSTSNRNVKLSSGKNGSVTMRNEVPGKVPGSKAVYEKTVDSSGETISATKTTYDPKGEVVHVKDKLSQ